MYHLHRAVSGHREDLAVLRGDTEVDDGSRVAFQNASWFPTKRQNQEEGEDFNLMLTVLK